MNAHSIASYWLIFFSVVSVDCIGYEMYTHFRLTEVAVINSDLVLPETVANLGLRSLSQKKKFATTLPTGSKDYDVHFNDSIPPCSHWIAETIQRLVACGAMFEDAPGMRSLNHFFDPSHEGRSLTVAGLSWQTSPDWALQDNIDDRDPKQRYSYWQAREYFYGALTTKGMSSAQGGRDELWGKTFQTLGQIVHHLQDMAQPQHVRNDAHYDGLSGLLGPIFTLGFIHPSRFEKYSAFGEGRARIDSTLNTGEIDAAFPTYRPTLRTPRDFWLANGAGISEYTNGNFLSQRTNFVADAAGLAYANPSFPRPVPAAATEVSVTEAFAPGQVPAVVRQFCSNVGLDQCKMTFWSSIVSDMLANTSTVNPRASTESAFDEDLNGLMINYDNETGTIQTGRLFSLNRLNFDAAYPFLIPKAVSYSAGLINYFFRGQMEINLPSAGVYSVVDHATESCADNCGFRKVKLKLKNKTHGEAMTSGSLVAVVKFRRNTCYRPDLSSEFILFSCRSSEEEIAVSDGIQIVAMNPEEELELEFTFGTVIPINATDIFLQVVFRGTLGSEQGAVAVTTRDISEPTFITTYNDTDYVAIGASCYKAGDVAVNDSLWKQLSKTCQDTTHGPRRVSDVCANMPLNISYTGGVPGHQVTVSATQGAADGRIPPRHFVRFAILGNADSPAQFVLGFNNPPLYLANGNSQPERFETYQLEETLDGTRVAGDYSLQRGINTWEALSFVIDGTTGAVGAACGTVQLDALLDAERLPAPVEISGW